MNKLFLLEEDDKFMFFLGEKSNCIELFLLFEKGEILYLKFFFSSLFFIKVNLI